MICKVRIKKFLQLIAFDFMASMLSSQFIFEKVNWILVSKVNTLDSFLFIHTCWTYYETKPIEIHCVKILPVSFVIIDTADSMFGDRLMK
jgi:hypothetical protein